MKKKRTKKDTNIIDYFTGMGIEYTLKYPQIFMALMSLSIKMKTDLPIEWLLRYEFSQRNVFYIYTTPDILLSLVDSAMKTKNGFACFLIAIIDCALKATNSIYNFVINNQTNERGKAASHFCAKLWKTLNEASSFKMFKGWIEDLNLYDEKYDDLYEKLYTHYLSTEKGLHDESIKQFIKREKIE